MNRRSLVAGIIGLAASTLMICAAPSSAQSSYESAIYSACASYGCNGDQLVRVMYCESGGDPGAVNPITGDTGLLQFHPETYYAYGGTDLWNPYEQIDIAAQMWADGLGYIWAGQ